jgi:hypothetical protein
MTSYQDINDNVEALAGNNLHRGNEIIPAVLDALTSDVTAIDLFTHDYMWADSLSALVHTEWHSMPEVNNAHPTVELTFKQPYYTTTPSGWVTLSRLKTKPAVIHNVLLEVTIAKYITGATVIIDMNTDSLGYEDIETFYIYIPTDGYYYHTSQKSNPMVFYIDPNPYYKKICIAVLPKEINIDLSNLSQYYSLADNSLFFYSLKQAYEDEMFIRKIRVVHTKSFINDIKTKNLLDNDKDMLYNLLGEIDRMTADTIRGVCNSFFRTNKSFELKVNLVNVGSNDYVNICRYEPIS